MQRAVSPLLEGAPRFTPSRLNDNEAILFLEAERESWIIYPPRSQYAHVRRPTRASVVVEHHPWAPLSDLTYHVLTVSEGCAEHGIECGAYGAVKAAAQMGWDAFG